MSFNDYVGRLKGADLETPVPVLPGQDPPPFGFNVPRQPQFQSEHNLKVLADYSRAFTDFWFYCNFSDSHAVPANGTISITKRIQNDTYFGLMYLIVKHYETVPGTIDTFDFQLIDASRNLSFFDLPCDSNLIAGTANEPFWLPNMIVFNPNSALQVQVTDTSGNANYPKILLGGRRYHT